MQTGEARLEGEMEMEMGEAAGTEAMNRGGMRLAPSECCCCCCFWNTATDLELEGRNKQGEEGEQGERES